jgi:nucleotide-binding universal stress UspA family protein
MFPIKTILYPTDFSPPSGCALDMAFALARDHGARLVLLHVLPPFIATETYLPPSPQECRDEAWTELRQLYESNPKARELRVATQIGEGDPAREILRVAADTDADLIVMGTHGRTGLRRLLMGSVAEQVLRRAPCPVLTVKGAPLGVAPAEEAKVLAKTP